MTRHALTPILALLLLLAGAGCPKSATVGTPDPQADLKKVARALDDISIAASSATDLVITLRQSNLIDADERTTINNILRKVIAADSQAVALVRDLGKLDQTSKVRISEIVGPVFKSFREATNSGLLGVKNQDSRAKVTKYLDGISASINIIEAVISLRN